MAWYSSAERRDLGKTTYPMDAEDLLLCLHTCVGSLAGTDSYFRTVGVFSHFGIGGKWGADATKGLDGVVYQWGDTAKRAAANLNGNRRIISVETADNAARPIQPWTSAQQTAIVNLMVWAHGTHGIPLVLVPDSKPGRRGIAYHRLGCPPYMVAGGELWTSSTGKDCPTQARIDQIPALIERARDVVNGIDQEDVSIVDAATKEYLDGKFATVISKIQATGVRLADVQREGIDGRALLLAGLQQIDAAGTSEEDIQRTAAAVAELVNVLDKAEIAAAIKDTPWRLTTDEPAA